MLILKNTLRSIGQSSNVNLFKVLFFGLLLLFTINVNAQITDPCEEAAPTFTGIAETTLCEKYGAIEPEIVIGAGTSTTHTSQLGSSFSGDVYIAGDLLVDNHFTFLNCRVQIAPGIGIFVETPASPGFGWSLALDNSKLFACNDLWQGITLKNNARILSRNNTIIEDADKAIAAEGSLFNQLFISNTNFNRNRIGIILSAPTGSSAMPVFVQFTDNSFTCTAPLNGTADKITFAGIVMPIAVGGGALNQATAATFSDLENGIFSLIGTTTIIGRAFRFDRIKRHGILMREGSLTLRQSNFNNCERRGIRIFKANQVDVRSTSFRFDWNLPTSTLSSIFPTGVRIHGFGLSSKTVLNVNVWAADLAGEMTNIRGLHLGGGIVDAGTDIKISVSDFSIFSENSSGIFLDGTFPPSSNTRIELNTFACAAPDNLSTEGILTLGDKNNLNILSNTFNERSNNSKAVGIRAMSSTGTGNIINGNHCSTNDFAYNGCFLTTNNFSNATICTNHYDAFFGNNTAFAFDGSNFGTVFTENTMIGPGTGVDILPNSVITPQEHQGNEWYPTEIFLGGGIVHLRSQIHAICQGCNFTSATDNKFTVHTEQSVWDDMDMEYDFFSEYHPENVFPDNSDEFFGILPGNPAGGCATEIADPSISDFDKKISYGLFQPPTDYPAMGWLGDRYLYQKLNNSTELIIEHSSFPVFLTNHQNTTVGQFYEVSQKITQAFQADNDVQTEGLLFIEQMSSLADSLLFMDSLLAVITNQTEIEVLASTKSSLLQEIISINNNLDSLSEIYNNHKTGLLQEAFDLNQAIQTTHIYETNEKMTNNIYLSSILYQNNDLTEAQINELILIAQQCPEDGGLAVRHALTLLPECVEATLSLCEQDTLQLIPAITDTIWFNGQNQMIMNNGIGSNSIYPNPSNQVFYIPKSGKNITKISITDISGKTVLQRTINENNEDRVEINHNLTNGIYFVRLLDTNGRSTVEKITVHSN